MNRLKALQSATVQSKPQAENALSPSERPDGRTPVIILGSGITALGVMRRLGRIGVTSYLADPAPGMLRHSRWFKELPPSNASVNPSDPGLEQWLLAQRIDRAVLFPCSDEAVIDVAALPPSTARRFPASVPPVATARALVDKLDLASLLQAQGIPHPRTVAINAPGDLDAVDDDFLGNAFLKPTNSQQFYRTFRKKAIGISGRSDARKSIASILSKGLGVIAQEMIPGPPEAQVCIDGFVDRHGVIRARFARRWLRKYPADFGESTLAVSIALEEVSEAVDLAERVLGLMPYRGVFSVEFKQDQRDGGFRVLEINTRPWWYVGFTAHAGVDVCRMAYDDALGADVQTVQAYRIGLRVVYPELDWSARASQPAPQRETITGVLKTWGTAIQPVFSWTDPGPAVSSTLGRLRRYLGRIRGRVGTPEDASRIDGTGRSFDEGRV